MTAHDVLDLARKLAVSDTDRGFLERLEDEAKLFQQAERLGVLDRLNASLGIVPRWDR